MMTSQKIFCLYFRGTYLTYENLSSPFGAVSGFTFAKTNSMPR